MKREKRQRLNTVDKDVAAGSVRAKGTEDLELAVEHIAGDQL